VRRDGFHEIDPAVGSGLGEQQAEMRLHGSERQPDRLGDRRGSPED
jgi:hypothetical protein